MRAALCCLLGVAAPACFGQHAAAGIPESLLRSLDLAVTEKGWRYDRICLSTMEREPRLLTREQAAKVAEFLENKVLPAQDQERALAQPLISELLKSEMPPEQTRFFDKDLVMTPLGRNAVVGAAAEAMWESCVRNPRASGGPSIFEGMPVSLSMEIDDWAKPLVEGLGAGPRDLPSFLGPLPVDQAAAGRGYHLAGEGARVLEPGESRLSLHGSAANYLFSEDGDAGAVRQNFETHSLALSLRRGITIFDHALEAGLQVELHRNGEGFLDRFIEGIESGIAGLGNNDAAINNERFDGNIPRGYRLQRHGQTLFEHEGRGDALGDVLLTLKGALIEAEPHAISTRLAWRLAANIGSWAREFSGGNFLGAGLSLEQPISGWLALHADARAALPLEREDVLGLDLRRAVFGATVGLEAMLFSDTSLGFQIDMNQSPYLSSGLEAVDAHQGALSLGLSHLARIGTKEVLVRIYGSENFVPWPLAMGHDLNYDFMFAVMTEFRF